MIGDVRWLLVRAFAQSYPDLLRAQSLHVSFATFHVGLDDRANVPSITRLCMQALNEIHQKMHTAAQLVGAEIDAIFFCPHAAEDNCDCRKPKPGMFIDIGKRFDTSLRSGVPVVGDSLRDLQAGFVSGCTPYLVLTGKGEKTREKGGLPPGTMIFPDLAAMVDFLLKKPMEMSV